MQVSKKIAHLIIKMIILIPQVALYSIIIRNVIYQANQPGTPFKNIWFNFNP